MFNIDLKISAFNVKEELKDILRDATNKKIQFNKTTITLEEFQEMEIEIKLNKDKISEDVNIEKDIDTICNIIVRLYNNKHIILRNKSLRKHLEKGIKRSFEEYMEISIKLKNIEFHNINELENSLPIFIAK